MIDPQFLIYALESKLNQLAVWDDGRPVHERERLEREVRFIKIGLDEFASPVA